VEGDHFGEIGLLYRCKRTATVISRNYNTVATITRHALIVDLNHEFPQYMKLLKKNIYKYKESKKTFIRNAIDKVEYLKNFNDEQFHEFYFGLT